MAGSLESPRGQRQEKAMSQRLLTMKVSRKSHLMRWCHGHSALPLPFSLSFKSRSLTAPHSSCKEQQRLLIPQLTTPISLLLLPTIPLLRPLPMVFLILLPNLRLSAPITSLCNHQKQSVESSRPQHQGLLATSTP